MNKYIFILISFFFSRCENQNNAEQKVDRPQPVAEKRIQEDSEKSVATKKYLEYHEDGSLKIKGMNNENGLRHGVWSAFYPDGTKWSESHYINGAKEGHSVTFYPNGNIRYIGEYKNDKQTGEWSFYNEEGKQTDQKKF